MHDLGLRTLARARVRAGETTQAVARDLGVAQSTVSRWAARVFASDTPSERCSPCRGTAPDPVTATAYAYLLGQYLGDGHLVTRARVPVLRIYCCTDYPGVLDEVTAAVVAVRGSPPGVVRASHTERMVTVQSYWTHWPCLLPQHGPGRKHERPIVLTDWQHELVDEHPWALIRGLIHSDGCRALNTVRVRGVRYAYPRYFFANVSPDILAILGDALDTVGVAWRFNRPTSISVARREAVALMDAHVGPKT